MALVVYVNPGCPYCDMAREHLIGKGLEFKVYDAQNDPERQREMLALTNGDPIVPVIVENGRVISSGWGDPPRGCVIIPS